MRVSRLVLLLSVQLTMSCAGERDVAHSAGDACALDEECESNLCYDAACLDPAADEDGDGLTNAVEIQLTTEVAVADSDGDGAWDGIEVAGQLDAPPDADGDGKIDALESFLVISSVDGHSEIDDDCLAPQYDPQDDVDNSAEMLLDLVCCCEASCDDVGITVASYTCEAGVPVCRFLAADDIDQDALLPDCDDDDDGDGVLDVDDCAPTDPERRIAGDELCDGADNDCDGETDEALGETTCGVGACEQTVANCADGVVQSCDPQAGATDEVCDGVDNDCDGQVDEDCLHDCLVTGSVVGTSPSAAGDASGHTVFAGDYAYVLQLRESEGDDIELSIVDMSDGTDPQMVLLPNVQTGGTGNSTALNDANFPRRGLIDAAVGYLYVSSATGFQVVDVAEPSAGQTIFTHTILGQAYGMVHHPHEPVVYAATITWAGDGALSAIDVQVPGNISSEVHDVAFETEMYDVAIGAGNRLYLVGADLSLQALDITAPLQPTVVGTLSGVDAPTDGAETIVAVRGGLAVVASTLDGYRIVDISDSAEMVVVYEDASPAEISAMAFFEGYLLLATRWLGLVILDIALPTNPEVVATIEVGGTPRGVHVVGHRVFVSTSSEFLKVIDLTLPCTDGDFCSLDSCHVQDGCDFGDDTVCDDLNPCTSDSCSPAVGCAFQALPECDLGAAGVP